MLAVLLLILKITGILLLSILGLVLLIALIVLFVPVRYKVVATRTGLDGDPPVNARIRVTWLLHIVNIHVDYPSEVWLKVRLFIFTLLKMPDSKKNQKSARKKKKQKDAATAEVEHTEQKEAESEPKADAKEAATQEETASKQPESDEINKEVNLSSEEEPEQTEKKPKKNILHTIRAFYDKIVETIRTVRDKITNMEETLQSLKGNVVFYRDVIESSAFKDSLQLAFGQLSGVLKNISPRKCRIMIEEGMGDPATTATVLAVFGILYPWIYDKITITGNFEEQIIKADVFIKGRITFFRILYAGIRIYFNKQFKTLIRMFKKEAKS